MNKNGDMGRVCGLSGWLLAGAMSVLPLISQADACKEPPPTLKEGAGPPIGAFHYGVPHIKATLSGDRVITYWGMQRNENKTDTRIIVWDVETNEPLVMYYSGAESQRDQAGAWHIPPNALAFPARFFEFSADGRLAGFERGHPLKGACVDVYRDGVHVARYRNRRLGGFHGDTLVMYEPGRKPRQVFVQRIGEPQNNRGIRLTYEGNRVSLLQLGSTWPRVITGAGNSHVAGQGVIVRLNSGLSFKGEFRGTTRLLFNPDTGETRIWPMADGSRVTDVDRRRIHTVRQTEHGPAIFVRAFEEVELALPFPSEDIEKLSFLDALHIDSDYLLLVWREEGKRENRQGWAQVFDYATGMPLHALPVRVSGLPRVRQWKAGSHGDSAKVALVNERYLYFLPPSISLMVPERIDVFEGTVTQLAWMRPVDDAERLQNVVADIERRNQEHAEMIRQHRAQIESNPFIRRMHEHGPSDPGDAEIYCRLGGPRCAEFQRLAQARQAARNREAEAANLRRIQELYRGDRDIGYEARRRQECLRRKHAPTALANPEFRGQSTGTCP